MSDEKKAERVYRHRDKTEREEDTVATAEDDRSRMSTLTLPAKTATAPGATTATAQTGTTGPAAATTTTTTTRSATTTPTAPTTGAATTNAAITSGSAAHPETPGPTHPTTPDAKQKPDAAAISAKAPTAPAAPQKRAPVVVPPSAVSRTSGSMPSLSTRTRDESTLPAQISAKVCIDTGGGVTSATVLSKIADDLKAKVAEAIRGWRYTPYKDGGTGVPACFVASFRSK